MTTSIVSLLLRLLLFVFLFQLLFYGFRPLRNFMVLLTWLACADAAMLLILIWGPMRARAELIELTSLGLNALEPLFSGIGINRGGMWLHHAPFILRRSKGHLSINQKIRLLFIGCLNCRLLFLLFLLSFFLLVFLIWLIALPLLLWLYNILFPLHFQLSLLLLCNYDVILCLFNLFRYEL